MMMSAGWSDPTAARCNAYCVISDTNCAGRNLDATVTSVFVVSLSTLKSRTCSNAVFRDSDVDDCDTAGAANFPWDFGDSSELPVLNEVIGGLDADEQRYLIDP